MYELEIIEVKENVYESKWIPQSNRFVSCGDKIKIYKYFNEIQLLKEYSFENIKSISTENRELLYSNFQGNISMYDIEKEIIKFEFKGNEKMINKIERKDNLLITCSRDGNMKYYDIRNPYQCIYTLKSNNDCWSVKLNKNEIFIGYSNGSFKILDMKKNEIKEEIELKYGICDIDIKEDILISCLNGYYYENFKMKQIDEPVTIWNGKYYKKDKILGDGNGNIYYKKEKKKLNSIGIINIDLNKEIEELILITTLSQNIHLFLIE